VLGLEFALGLDAQWANAFGYGAGFLLGFALNRRFVFADAGPAWRSLGGYGLAGGAAFAANQLVLYLVRHGLGHGRLASVAAQGAAVGCGAVLFFVLCRLWVFRRAAPAPVPKPAPQPAQAPSEAAGEAGFEAVRLSLMRETGGDYQRLLKSLRPAYARVWRDIGLGYAALVALLVVVSLPAPLWVRVPAVLAGAPLIGYAVAFLQLFIHEGAHFNLHRDRAWNDRLTDVFVSWQVGGGVKAYRRTHFAHHSQLGGVDDTERSYFNALTGSFLIQMLTGVHAVRVFIGRIRAPAADTPAEGAGLEGVARLTVGMIVHLALMAGLFVLGGWPPVLAWALGVGVFYPFFATLRQLLEHRSARADPRTDYSRTAHGAHTRLFRDGPLAATFGGAGFSRHLLHHWEPHISYTRLKELEVYLEGAGAGALTAAHRTTYWSALKEIWANDNR
jgi:fatty acid desaturase/putative flippase GtrA